MWFEVGFNSGAPPLAWITLTLKRRCWALYHRQVASQQLIQAQQAASTTKAEGPLVHHQPGVEERIEATETKTQTREAIERLKPAERTAITYQALGYSYKEIGTATGWTYTKVNRCIAEGRAKLRSQQTRSAR